ncbi:MAG: gas vesicle protein GvpN, partial [Bacteroidota bacterium]
MQENQILLSTQPLPNFVETEYIKKLTRRAICYIQAGFAVHFRGPAGTGKTTLAKHLAYQLGQATVLIQGDETLSTSDLIGSETGYTSQKVVDNYISSVVKREENFYKNWTDNRLTLACKHGLVLIYDEFTRSRPEANNVLLSVLEEGILNFPSLPNDKDPYLPVHKDFKAIFTSNPEEYAGVHKTQDALRDRMITIDLDYFDLETELQIVQAKSQLPIDDVRLIVNVVRAFRHTGKSEVVPTIRGGIMIAKTLKVMQMSPWENIEEFTAVCQDVLASETSRQGALGKQLLPIKEIIREIIHYQIELLSP